VVAEIIAIVLWSFFAGSVSTAASRHAAEPKTIVVFVDAGAQGLTYHVDGAPVPRFEVRRSLERMWDRSLQPEQQRKVVIVLHADVTFARAEDLRLVVRAANYEDPRVFYFGKDRRLMVEVTYRDAIAFSPNGPGLEYR
jgi:hypothetical protein